MIEWTCRRCRQRIAAACCETVPPDATCRGCREVIARLPDAPQLAPVYGWRIVYGTNHGREAECHYVGTLRAARRKAMMRPNAKDVITVEAFDEKHWVACFGRGRT